MTDNADKIERSERFLNRISDWLNWGAVAGIAIMLALVVVDVVGAKLFIWPVPGAVEMAEFLGLVIIALALPYLQVIHGQIEVEVACRGCQVASIKTWQPISANADYALAA